MAASLLRPGAAAHRDAARLSPDHHCGGVILAPATTRDGDARKVTPPMASSSARFGPAATAISKM